jgi:type II secretory pathway pseudopilin PulG
VINCLSSKKGLTLIELLIVNCIISVITAVLLLTYFSQKEKAYSIILKHDLINFSRDLNIDYTEDGTLDISKGQVFTDKNKDFSISKGVKIKILEINSDNPFGDSPFIAKADLNKKTIYFDLKNNMVKKESVETSYSSFKIVKFFKYFLYVLGSTLIFASTLIYILRIGSRKK